MNQARKWAFIRRTLLLAGCLMIMPNLNGEDGPVFNGRLITTFAISDDLDDTVPHYADASGHRKTISLRESELSFSLSRKNMQVQAGIDFMGSRVQLVTLSTMWTFDRFHLLIGKDANLLATAEVSLFYDGYFTSGGIHSGARANLNQMQVGWRITERVTARFAFTDEKAMSGGTDNLDFKLGKPAMELALTYTHPHFDFRIASHRGDMELFSGERFHPSIVMTDIHLHVSSIFRLYLAGYRKQAGSQFIALDPTVDYIRLSDGRLSESHVAAGMAQFILELPYVTAWMGIGAYRVSNSTKYLLLETTAGHVLIQNKRLSAGIVWKPSLDWEIGLEYATFSTRHLETGTITHGSGSILVCRLSRSF